MFEKHCFGHSAQRKRLQRGIKREAPAVHQPTSHRCCSGAPIMKTCCSTNNETIYTRQSRGISTKLGHKTNVQLMYMLKLICIGWWLVGGYAIYFQMVCVQIPVQVTAPRLLDVDSSGMKADQILLYYITPSSSLSCVYGAVCVRQNIFLYCVCY